MIKRYSRKDLIKIAIEEQRKCTEFPRVGAVIEKNGIILSTGFRGESKKKHAERIAIEKLNSEQLQNSTLYTTLEPCISVQEGQKIESCADLIIRSGIIKIVIGVLDPNGTIYTQGYKKLLENKIHVSFFNRNLREAVEKKTYDYGELHSIVGPGKRRIPVVNNGTCLTVQFSESDNRAFQVRWDTLQPNHGCVDLLSVNGAVRVASGATDFAQITDPLVFRFPGHYARMKKGMIAVVRPRDATFCLLVKLIELYDNGVHFQWEMRNLN